MAQQIVKIGNSLDYGICEANNKDGNRCTTVVNLSKGKYCEKHINDFFNKTQSSRKEFNSVYTPTSDMFKKKKYNAKQLAQNGIFVGKNSQSSSSLSSQSSSGIIGMPVLSHKEDLRNMERTLKLLNNTKHMNGYKSLGTRMLKNYIEIEKKQTEKNNNIKKKRDADCIMTIPSNLPNKTIKLNNGKTLNLNLLSMYKNISTSGTIILDDNVLILIIFI